LDGVEVRPGVPFQAGDDWFSQLRIVIENVSVKKIVFVTTSNLVTHQFVWKNRMFTLHWRVCDRAIELSTFTVRLEVAPFQNRVVVRVFQRPAAGGRKTS
jgi:hypothetical protein